MDKKLMIIALCAIFAVVLVFSLAYPYFHSSSRAKKRRAALSQPGREPRATTIDQTQRRKAIAETVKVLESRNAGRVNDLRSRILQAGLLFGVNEFWIGVAIFTAVVSAISFWFFRDPLVTISLAALAGVGLPQWMLSFLIARRIKKFIAGFPETIDVIIRGVRAGLPVADCFRMIATESPEPLSSEFRRVVDAQAVGLTMGEAVEKLADRIRTPETSFFAIVLNIQEKTGGNLSEALGNLSSVLRERKRMKEKVKAISSEAKASAAIIGSLPFLVAVLVYFFSPDYIMLLFNSTMGNIIIGVSLVWMALGAFIMRSMINFDV